MSSISGQEASKLQAYFQKKFNNKGLTLRARERAGDSVEVLLDGEFLGVVYKDEDEGETSYDFNMAILDIDVNG